MSSRVVIGSLALGGVLALWPVSLAGSKAQAVMARGTVRSQTPSLFAAVEGSASGEQSQLELRSAETGSMVRVLARFGSAFTNNGLVYAPDAGYVYFTLNPRSSSAKSLLLERTEIATGKQTLLARGEEPALSPDGGSLAYVEGEGHSATVAVRDVQSARTRLVNVSRLLNRNEAMVNATLAWFGNGTRLAVFPGSVGVALKGRASVRLAGTPARVAPSIGSGGFIVVSTTGRRLRAREVPLPKLANLTEASTDGSRSNSLLIINEPGFRSVLYRLRLRGAGAALDRILTIPRSDVLGFDPTGRGLLYVHGSHPPALWTARFSDGQLSKQRRLISNSPLQAVAW